MKSPTFKIEGQIFHPDARILRGGTFDVSSVPRPYKVYWDQGSSAPNFIKSLMSKTKNVLLVDSNIYKLYLRKMGLPKNRVYIAKATEAFKTLKGVLDVIAFLDRNKITKGETLIVVGGGIIQDVGAFVGCMYKRGIPWIFIPTTLLSMCDSCIGGKTGINHGNAKNQLALFSAPRAVHIHPSFIRTLSDKDIMSGLGEILKLLATGGEHFLKIYEQKINKALLRDIDALKPLILGSLCVKKAIVEADEFELNIRKSLNYGHTLGHVVEALSGYRICHGLAVIIGMIIANELSFRKRLLSKNENDHLNGLCMDLLSDNIMKGITFNKMLVLLAKDKKTVGKRLFFAVLRSAGDIKFMPLVLNDGLKKELASIAKEKFNI